MAFSTFAVLCFPDDLGGKDSACNGRGPSFDPWVKKIPWRRKWQPTPVFWPGEFHGQRRLAGYNPWGSRVRHDWGTNTFTLSLFHNIVQQSLPSTSKALSSSQAKTQYALNNLPSPSLSPQPQTTTLQLSVCMNLTNVWQIMQYLSFSGWLISSSNNVLNMCKRNVSVAGNPDEMNSE